MLLKEFLQKHNVIPFSSEHGITSILVPKQVTSDFWNEIAHLEDYTPLLSQADWDQNYGAYSLALKEGYNEIDIEDLTDPSVNRKVLFEIPTHTVSVTSQQIAELIHTAWSSNLRWITEIHPFYPPSMKWEDFTVNGRFGFVDSPDDYYHPQIVLALTPRCGVIVHTHMNEKVTLDLDAIEKGLKLLKDQYPEFWNDFLSASYNLEVASTFLQLALFGEVQYSTIRPRPNL